MSNKSYFLTLGALAVLFFAGVYGYQNGWFRSQDPPVVAINEQQENKSIHSDKRTDDELRKKGLARKGGVVRDLREYQEVKRQDIGDKERAYGEKIGKIPLYAPNTNAYTKSIAEAYENPEKFPERLSTAFLPKPFNKEEFERDPEKYLTTVEPGRVFQHLSPGKDATPIKSISPVFHKLIQGESVPLQVKVEPGAPVTFHSFEVGQFDNKLGTMTVRADKEGFAKVNFKAPSGSFDLVNISAASPLNSNRATFVIRVLVPGINTTP